MNYRRVMRTPLLQKARRPRWRGSILVLAGCGAEENAAAHCGGPLRDHRERHACAQDAAAAPSAAVTTSRNISTNPEVATGYRKDMTAVRTAHYAVATANPLATQEACEVLNDGGTAADALVTAQAVLGLVEPQSSGIGGGGFLLYYDAAAGSVQAYDGRETAPAAATRELPALDLRRRPHRAQARRPRVRPVHRRAGHPATAAGRPHRARQDRVA